MRVLAIETVESTGSAALLEDGNAIVERALDTARRSAQTLAPGIAELLAERQWSPGDVELVAVASGPGSFTGLRIGVTTAKVFAYAVGCPAVGVNTLAAIAAQVPEEVCRVSAILDAQRGELFVADFVRATSGELRGEETTRVVEAERWLAELAPGTVVTGPGLARWKSRVVERGGVPLEEALWRPVASAVGRVGVGAFAAGKSTNVLALAPQYFRRTAAEEQWERKRAR